MNNKKSRYSRRGVFYPHRKLKIFMHGGNENYKIWFRQSHPLVYKKWLRRNGFNEFMDSVEVRLK